MALFIMLYKVVQTYESEVWVQSVTIQMKAIEQYFPVVLFIMLYKVVLTFEPVDAVCYAVDGGSTFWVCV